MRGRWSSLNTKPRAFSDLEGRKEIIRFLGSLADDPENCATSAAEEKLVEVEGRLVQLKVGEGSLTPDWLYQCHQIDLKIQKCVGGTPYEDEIPRDTNEVLRTGHELEGRGGVGMVSIAPEAACRVKAVSVSEFQWFFVKGPSAESFDAERRKLSDRVLKGHAEPGADRVDTVRRCAAVSQGGLAAAVEEVSAAQESALHDDDGSLRGGAGDGIRASCREVWAGPADRFPLGC